MVNSTPGNAARRRMRDDGGVGGSRPAVPSPTEAASRPEAAARSPTMPGGDGYCDCDATDGSPGVGVDLHQWGRSRLPTASRRSTPARTARGRRPRRNATAYSDGTCGHAAGPGNQPSALTARPLAQLWRADRPAPTLRGSAAIDKGDPAGCVDAEGHLLATDQRGLPRRQSGRWTSERRAQPGEAPERSHAADLDRLLPLKVWIASTAGVTAPFSLTCERKSISPRN